jgi:hypothetical protein
MTMIEMIEEKYDDDVSTFQGGWGGPSKAPVPIGSMNLKSENFLGSSPFN